jgi:hypothetical protein
MRRLLVFIVIVSLLGLGCLEERNYIGSKSEQITNTQSIDLDNDGSPDYLVYDFSPYTITDAGMKVQRQITVAVQTDAAYDTTDDNITDVDLLIAGQSIDEFSKSRTQSDSACSNNIGLMNVVCSDVVTCSGLCSRASLKCKKVAATYEDILAGSMISYVQDNNEIRSLVLDASRMVVTLRGAPEQDKNDFLQKTRSIIFKVASINANPLYTSQDLGMCEHSDFGMSFLTDAAAKIGTYTSTNTSYKYRVLISVKPIQQTGVNQLGVEVGGVSITDHISRSAVPQGDAISSIQSISASQDASNAVVAWSSPKPSKDGYSLLYEFKSDQPPEAVLASLKDPDVKVKMINFMALIPTNMAFTALQGIVKNYYLALGLAIGLTLAVLVFIYNVLILLFTIISEKAAGASLVAGFRRAFGRTDVRWRTDFVIAAVFLGIGFYVSTYLATQPSVMPLLVESLDFLLKSEMGLLGVGLVAIGAVMAYFSVDNFVKITVLERAYGMVIKQEKDLFLAKVATLKDRISQLGILVEEYSKDNFDASKEYDLLSSMKSENIDNLAKEMTGRTKAVVEDSLNKVESSIGSLKERKKMADDNWPRWKDAIGKMLDEQGEVYQTSLVTIPASLRVWATSRFAQESGAEGVILDRDVLKKKKVSPDTVAREMINKGLLKGVIVIKQDKITLAEFAEGSGTVASVLALKLRAYLQSLAKNMGQHAPQSFVTIGDKQVLVIMKGRNMESVLFINKAKFNEAVEQWKTVSKAFDAA